MALAEFPQIERVSLELGKKKDQFRISLQSKVDDYLATMENFNRQFQINKKELNQPLFLTFGHKKSNIFWSDPAPAAQISSPSKSPI